MHRIEIEDFDLEQIMNSGQVFRMYRLDGGRYRVMAGDRYLELEQNGTSVGFDCTEEDYADYWYNYFDVGTDYSAIKNVALQLPCDAPGAAFLQAAVSGCGGIRILRQELWEMLITFILSQQKQIPSIRRCVEAVCSKFGTPFEQDGHAWNGFPCAEAIAAGGPEGLEGLSLGYRARYIYETSVSFAKNPVTSEELSKLPYDEAKAYLKGFCGVGEKVANCVCLFGLGMVDAFPIDVHIKDILYREYYRGALSQEKLTDKDYLELAQTNFSCFSGFRGIIQQWIFAYEIDKTRGKMAG